MIGSSRSLGCCSVGDGERHSQGAVGSTSALKHNRHRAILAREVEVQALRSHKLASRFCGRRGGLIERTAELRIFCGSGRNDHRLRRLDGSDILGGFQRRLRIRDGHEQRHHHAWLIFDHLHTIFDHASKPRLVAVVEAWGAGAGEAFVDVLQEVEVYFASGEPLNLSRAPEVAEIGLHVLHCPAERVVREGFIMECLSGVDHDQLAEALLSSFALLRIAVVWVVGLEHTGALALLVIVTKLFEIEVLEVPFALCGAGLLDFHIHGRHVVHDDVDSAIRALGDQLEGAATPLTLEALSVQTEVGPIDLLLQVHVIAVVGDILFHPILKELLGHRDGHWLSAGDLSAQTALDSVHQPLKRTWGVRHVAEVGGSEFWCVCSGDSGTVAGAHVNEPAHLFILSSQR